jgi:hypothetical protein
VAVDATQKSATVTGMCVARFDGGMIIEARNNADFPSLYQQFWVKLALVAGVSGFYRFQPQIRRDATDAHEL